MARRRTTRARVHRFTVDEDCNIINFIVRENKSIREVSQLFRDDEKNPQNITPSQIIARLVTLKSKGLRMERLNTTKEVIHISLLNPQAFNPNFQDMVNTLNSNVCVPRENAHTANGDKKVVFKTWTRAELNTLQFFKSKSNKELSKLLGRSIDTIEIKKSQLIK